MAELDIKELWAKGKERQSSQVTLDIDEVIGKKSDNVLYWVKFILWIEFWITVASFPFIIWSTVYGEDAYSFKVINVVAMCLMVLYLFYYQFLIKKINAFDYTDDVYSSLSKLYGYLRFYLLHYRVIVWVFVPFFLFLGAFLGFREDPEAAGKMPLWSTEFWIFMGILALITLVIVLVMHFLVNLIYGRKIRKLKGMIRELGS